MVRDYVFSSLKLQCLVQCLTQGGRSVNEWAANYTFINYHRRFPTSDRILAESMLWSVLMGANLLPTEKAVSLSDTARMTVVRYFKSNANVRIKRPANESHLALPLLKENQHLKSTQMCKALSKMFLVQGTKQLKEIDILLPMRKPGINEIKMDITWIHEWISLNSPGFVLDCFSQEIKHHT